MGNTNAKPHPKPRNKKQVRWRAAERPSPPGKPSLLQENGLIPDLIHICWQKPEKDGGSPIILYLVEHRRVGSSHWTKSNTHPVTTTELAVNGLEPGWRYQFRIRAENAVGLSDCSEISEPFTVILHRSVITAPKFTQELKEATVLEESKVEFEVHFLGQPIPSICWFKDGFEIFSSNRIRIMTVSDKSVLTILHATIADEGEIKCTGTNKAGHASTKGKLTVEAPPTIRLPKSYQDQDGIIFEIGETIGLNVFVGGRPTPLVFWSHNGESIQNDDRHELEYLDNTATLKIENAIRSDRGEYQIKAVNKLSQDQASFLVTITDKPTPPGKARVLSASGKSVTLSWTTPEDDGGCKIGSYIVEYYRIGWNVWLKAAACRQMTTMLGNLIEGSQYVFRVKAESPYGVSDPSEVSDPLFIPDPKRGINHPKDIKREENQSLSSLEPSRTRRGSSSPRVSFSLNEDMPVRPERKKTGKTPEASPRLKRKQLFPTSTQEEDIQFKADASIPSSNLPLAIPSAKQEKSSPSILRKDFSNRNISDEASIPTTERRKSLNISENSYNSIQGGSFEKEKTKSPSPEILITLAENENKKNFGEPTSYSLDRSPVQRRRSFSGINNSENNDSLKSNFEVVKSPSIESLLTGETVNRIRPPLNRQEFSGSSEFMLVLCPEGEQGAQLREFGIDFDGESIPPPISLSAPELGTEPPQEPLLRRSSSSSELLNFHLMERLRFAVFAEKENSEVNKNDVNNKRNLDIPTIQLNSKPTDQLSGLERKPSHNRRLSVEIVPKSPQNWSQRRYSLKNSNDMGTRKLKRFQETEENKRQLLEYRQAEMKLERDENYSTNSGTKEFANGYSMEYEESISSEEETDSSSNEPSNSNISPTSKYEEEDAEETYNPRNRTVMSTTVSKNDPFEILTVRKDPPSTSIVPKPILKKKSNDNVFNVRDNPTFSGWNTKRERSHSLTDDSSLYVLSERNNQRKQRQQSNSPTYIDTIEVDTIEEPPNVSTRRSFSLLPSQTTLLKETFRSRKKKVPSSVDVKPNESRSVSALANCTSITGTGVIMKEKVISNKEIEEEAKVVVDFYGDIVKSYGGKQKPVAEISNIYDTKYDTFEEKKIYEPEIKEFVQNKTQMESAITSHEPVSDGNESRLNTGNSSAFASYNYERHEDSIHKMNRSANLRDSNIGQVDYKEFKYPGISVSPSRKRQSPLVDDTSPQRTQFRNTRRTEKSKSRSNSSITKRSPRSRDASTSPVRFEYWEHDVSSRHSLERDYFRTSSVTSSRSSSLTRQTHSPVRPVLKAITTQTSFRVEPPTPADILKKQVELATKAEKRMKGVFEYFTDLAMMSVACWFYLFQSEYLAIPVLVILVYRQLSEKMKKFGESMKRYIPRWIMKKFTKNYDEMQP